MTLLPSEILDPEDSDETEDDSKLDPVDFKEFVLIIDKMFDESAKRVLVTAGGGYGKTTASKRLALHWSENECLQNCLLFLRIDFKSIKHATNLLSATLEQFPRIKLDLSENELVSFELFLKRKQEHVCFVLDGLDESKRKSFASDVFDPTKSEYPDSLVMILSRPEAKKYLETSTSYLETEVTEFELTRLSKEQYQNFALKFPYPAGKEEKGEELVKKCKEDPNFGKMMEVPMTAAANCALFSDPKLSKNLNDQVDLFYCLLALDFKFELLKQIDVRLAENPSAEEVERLQSKRREILELDVEEIFSLFQQDLVALGRAIFECNGRSFVGFSDCGRKCLEKSLLSEGVSEEKVKTLLRLSFLEEIIEEESLVPDSSFRFLHRDIREFVVTISVTLGTKEFPPQIESGNVKETHLSFFRCVLANLMKQKYTAQQLRERLEPLIRHILTHNSISKSKAAQMICELIHLYVTCQDKGKKEVISSLISPLKKSIADKIPIFSKNLSNNYLECLDFHFTQKDCDKCKLSENWGKEYTFSTSKEAEYRSQWPQQRPLRIFPFLKQELQSIRLIFPSFKFFKARKHATVDAILVVIKTTYVRKGMISQIKQLQIVCPPISYFV